METKGLKALLLSIMVTTAMIVLPVSTVGVISANGSTQTIAFSGFEDTGDTWSYVTEGGPDDPGVDPFGPTTSNPLEGSKSFEAADVSSGAAILFDEVDVDGYTNVVVHVWIDTNAGGFESGDEIKAFLEIDGTLQDTPFIDLVDDAGEKPLPAEWTEYTYDVSVASTIKLRIEMKNSADSEIYYFDSVSITGTMGEAETDEEEIEILVAGTPRPPVDIQVEPTSYDFGTMSPGEIKTTDPSPYFTVTNIGSEAVDITIKGSDAVNSDTGAIWTLSDDGSIGEDIFAMWFGTDPNWEVLNKGGVELKSDLAVYGTYSFDLKLRAPDPMTTGDDQLRAVVTLVAVRA